MDSLAQKPSAVQKCRGTALYEMGEGLAQSPLPSLLPLGVLQEPVRLPLPQVGCCSSLQPGRTAVVKEGARADSAMLLVGG